MCVPELPDASSVVRPHKEGEGRGARARSNEFSGPTLTWEKGHYGSGKRRLETLRARAAPSNQKEWRKVRGGA